MADERVSEEGATEAPGDAPDAASALLATLAHELRSPIHALTLNLELSLERLRGSTDGVPREWLLDKLERQQRTVQRLQRLVDTFLEVAQISAGRLPLDREPLDLGEVVRDVLRRFANDLVWAQCPVTLEAEAPVLGRWDRLQLDLVVSNLLSNALKYGAGRPVQISVRTEGETATLIVRDEGPGIAPEQRERVFEKFARLPTPARVSGFGLGLWIVRQAVEAHGGTVEVRSEPGRGAEFVVRLPRHL